eukprot:IDg5621t1
MGNLRGILRLQQVITRLLYRHEQLIPLAHLPSNAKHLLSALQPETRGSYAPPIHRASAHRQTPIYECCMRKLLGGLVDILEGNSRCNDRLLGDGRAWLGGSSRAERGKLKVFVVDDFSHGCNGIGV